MCLSLSVLVLQGSYWAIDTNPKEDALPTRPKKRPRSGERVGPQRCTHSMDTLDWLSGAPVHVTLFIFCPSSFVYFFLLVTYFCVSLSVSLVPPSFSVFLSIFCSRSRSLSYSIFDSPTLALILARSKCLSLFVSLFLSHTHTRAHTHTHSSALVIRHACHMWTHTEAHSGSCCRLHASGLHLHPAPVAPS